MEPSSIQSLKELTNKLINIAVEVHTYFDEHIWRQHPLAKRITIDGTILYPSFHNQHHVMATIKAAEAIVAQAIQSDKDPYNIHDELLRWNLSKIGTHGKHFTMEVFLFTMKIAFAYHDLGNITKSPTVRFHNGIPRFDYADIYYYEHAVSHERSAQILTIVIDTLVKDDRDLAFIELMGNVKELASHLIRLSALTPKMSSSKPFWLLVQIIDQIGAYFYSDNPSELVTAGFLNELYLASNHGAKLNEYINFIPDRFETLVRDEELQKDILDIFDPPAENGRTRKRDYLLKRVDVEDRLVDYDRDIELLVQRAVMNKDKAVGA